MAYVKMEEPGFAQLGCGASCGCAVPRRSRPRAPAEAWPQIGAFGLPEQPIEPRAENDLRSTRPMTQREADEAEKRRIQATVERDCRGVDVLETLERVARTPAQKVKYFEDKIAALPRLLQGLARLRELRELRKRGAFRKPGDWSPAVEVERFSAALMGLHNAFKEIELFPFPPGYVVQSLERELAVAHCQLSRARRDLYVFERTGQTPRR